MTDEIKSVFTIAKNHPALHGHFPGKPIVPGAILLDNVHRIIDAHPGVKGRITKLRHVKFMIPVIPGMEIHLNVTFAEERLACFELRCDEAVIAVGVVELAGVDDHDR